MLLILSIFPAEILQRIKNWGFWFAFKNKCDLIIYLWKKWKKFFTKLLGFGTLEQLQLFCVNKHFRLADCLRSFHLLQSSDSF